MIRLIEALNFRCLRYIHQPLEDFQVLIGPNASGKTTFLDVVAFLGDLLSNGLDEAVTSRTSNIRDLFFFGQGKGFELALELEVPQERLALLTPDQPHRYVRYEISIGLDDDTGEIRIFDEQVILLTSVSRKGKGGQRKLFPDPLPPPVTVMHGRQVGNGKKRVVRKVYEGNDNFYSEVQKRKGKGGWAPSIRLGPRKSALANMPEDERNFPVSTWLRETLINGTQKLMLNSLALRQMSSPGQGRLFRPDGSNLPWVIDELRKTDMKRHRQWVAQLQTALADVEDITTVERPDNRHRYLNLVYRGGLKVPSWTASDGTLRMLALTLPAFLPNFEGIYLIEEPENGIHPMAMETIYQALNSVYSAQILLATHSPVILGCARAQDVLCFKKTGDGATDVVRGTDHPALRQWQGNLNLTDLYASGVLG